MYNKAVDNYANASEFVSDCYKDEKMYNKVVYTYHSTMQFVPKCYKTQEICDKAVDTCRFLFGSVRDRCKAQ